MFEALSERLTGVFDTLTGRGALSEKDVDAAMREVRVALLEADVALPVVKSVVKKIRAEAVGEKVLKSVTPGQMVIAIVHQALVDMLGGEPDEETGEPPRDTRLNLNAAPPVVFMMTGLQGSGKTTTAGKIAKRLKERERKKVLLASLDVYRPAAMKQLQVLGDQVGVDVLPIVEGQQPADIARRALQAAKLQGFDVVILDTAGRTTLDDAMMDEAEAIARIAQPTEILLVADALTGQDAVRTAEAFNARLKLTGLALTRIDGDGRGGAALSMRAVTGLPIKLLGVSEKLDGLEEFDARRLADRILGRGDIVALVERAREQLDEAEAERMAKKMAKGEFDLEDLAAQFRQIRNMGGMGGVMGMLPGMGKMKKAMADAKDMMDDGALKRQEAIILSMTSEERKKPKVLNASRKKRIAAGSGVSVAEVNKVLKMHRGMADMMKMMKGPKGKQKMRGLMGALGGMGGMGGGMPDPAALEAFQREAQKDLAKKERKRGGDADLTDERGAPLPGFGNPNAIAGGPILPGLPGAGGLPGLPGGKKK